MAYYEGSLCIECLENESQIRTDPVNAHPFGTDCRSAVTSLVIGQDAVSTFDETFCHCGPNETAASPAMGKYDEWPVSSLQHGGQDGTIVSCDREGFPLNRSIYLRCLYTCVAIRRGKYPWRQLVRERAFPEKMSSTHTSNLISPMHFFFLGFPSISFLASSTECEFPWIYAKHIGIIPGNYLLSGRVDHTLGRN